MWPTLALTFVGLSLAAPPNPDPTADLFKPNGPVPRFKITVDKPNLDMLNREPRKYVRAQVKLGGGGETLTDVGLHLKGAAGSYRNFDDKPALTLNVDKFTKDQVFRGLDKFHLNNSVQDSSFLNEMLSAELALAMNLPAARATHAFVELNGRKVGLYVLKEGFDKTFLKRHFDDAKGNLYDGGFLQDIDAGLQLDSGTDNDRKDLKALVKACREGEANKRFAAIAKVLDVDRFITNMALQMVLADWDGYVRNRNNYRVYFNPKDGRAVFFPHGMDQELQRLDDGLWGFGGIVSQALSETPEGKAKYIAKVKEMAEKHFIVEKLNKRIDEVTPRVIEVLKQYQDQGTADWYKNEVKSQKDRIKQRADFLKREIPKLQ
ncbi:MAG: CotH kinase family protein [Gemmataceae bacterium]